jgi:hypothetical protein
MRNGARAKSSPSRRSGKRRNSAFSFLELRIPTLTLTRVKLLEARGESGMHLFEIAFERVQLEPKTIDFRLPLQAFLIDEFALDLDLLAEKGDVHGINFSDIRGHVLQGSKSDASGALGMSDAALCR